MAQIMTKNLKYGPDVNLAWMPLLMKPKPTLIWDFKILNYQIL